MNVINFMDILRQRKEEREKFFAGYRFYAGLIKKKAEEILGECRVMVFGSALRGDYHPMLSDIDILIISPLAFSVNKAETKVKILSQFPLGNPFEIHLITPEEYDGWYSKFIKDELEIF